MTLGDRCDHIIALIDEVLGSSAAPSGDARDDEDRSCDGIALGRAVVGA